MLNIETRIERLLDQLNNSALTVGEIERLEKKIEFLRSLEQQS